MSSYLATPLDPETQQTKALLEASMRPPGSPGYLPVEVTWVRILGLAQQRNQRVEQEQGVMS